VTAQYGALVTCGMLALSLRIATGTWVHPSTLFAGAWALFLAVTTLFESVMIPSPVTAWLIVGTILAVSVGAYSAIRTNEVAPASVLSSRWLARFVWAGSASAVLSALVTQRANSISTLGSLSVESVGLAARQMTALRYESALTTPAISIILLAISYGAALAAPFAAASQLGIHRAALMSAPAVGNALYAALTTARAAFLIAVAITIGSWVVVCAVTAGGRPHFSWRTLFFSALATSFVVFVFLWGIVTRYGGFSGISSIPFARIVGVYMGGSIPAFETWLHDTGSPQFGTQTFAGIAQFLFQDRSIGSTYRDFASIGDGVSTNVYTALRQLTEDFTLPGMFVALTVFSSIAAFGYRTAMTRKSVVGAVIASAWGAFVLFSQIISIFSFTNVTVGLIVGGIVICRFTEFEPIDDISSAEIHPSLVGDIKRSRTFSSRLAIAARD